VFSVGVPSAILTGLFDVANICVNILAAAHSDLVLAAMGSVMKVDRIANAINVGLCQGMLPIVAYNYSSGNHARMKETIRTARIWGMIVSFLSILLLELFARPVTGIFLAETNRAGEARIVLDFSALFLRIRCLASIFQLLNCHTSFCMQAMGNGKATMLHAVVRELVFYIPCMFLLDRLFGEIGLASALTVGEALGAAFALLLLKYVLNSQTGEDLSV
jgi:Na+-driven multidrug efflux pump